MKNKVLADGVRCVNKYVLTTLSRIFLHSQFWLWQDSFSEIVICSEVKEMGLTGCRVLKYWGCG